MDEVLEAIHDITSFADASVSKEQMKRAWNEMWDWKIGPTYARFPDNPPAFVREMHAYWRVERAVGTQEKAWNVFSSIIDEASNCNCICGTLFLLLACFAVGFFPGAISGAITGNHAFLIDASGLWGFETTRRCRTDWYPIVGILDHQGLVLGFDQFYLVSAISELISVYAINVILAEDLSLEDQKMLLDSYPLFSFPLYQTRRIRLLMEEYAPLEYVVSFLEKTLKNIEENRWVAAFANALVTLFYLILKHRTRPAYENYDWEEKLEQIRRMIERVSIYNPKMERYLRKLEEIEI